MELRKVKSCYSNTLFSTFIVLLLASCSVINLPNKMDISNSQPGALIQDEMAGHAKLDNSELKKFLLSIDAGKKTRALVRGNTDTIIRLYRLNSLAIVSEKNFQGSLLAESLSGSEDKANAITTLISLFPIDAYRILTYVEQNRIIDTSDILAIAVKKKLDPSIILNAAASGMENSATPLIHSAGLVIYGQNEENQSEVKYRIKGSSKWLPALALSWDPIYGALSGSIVHLDPNTNYEVEVLVTDYESNTKSYSFQFTTQPDSPPIDSEKIYYLSEIYNGGQLDLEALNIYGSEDGYAKVIGDGETIIANEDDLSAVNIGSQSYIILENLTIEGGVRYGIFAKNTHHIWIKGCNISKYGREATIVKNGKAYSSETSTSPINYDSGIYLEKTGVSVIEECEIHSPNGKANHWGYGHPNGPNALQVYAYHPEEQFRGQMIVRNNKFYGSDLHRFNDVIEGRKNTWRNGGFVRDSAIYGNYLAYANDDLIEIDGGQRNVLVYENELTQGYVGISVAPNMLGPSYLFHNYIHDLGDERGKEWTAIKAGGLLAKPGGKTYILENYIVTNRNGIAASNVNNDNSFWLEVRNNIIINRNKSNMVGLGIYDKQKYFLSNFYNNVIYNIQAEAPYIEVAHDSIKEHFLTYDSQFVGSLNNEPNVELPIFSEDSIYNFTRSIENVETPKNELIVNFFDYPVTPFATQTKYGTVIINDKDTLSLSGNGWYKIPVDYEITKDTVLSLNYIAEGRIEIGGVAFETDNKVTASRVFKFIGVQPYGHNLTNVTRNKRETKVNIPIGEYNLGNLNYIVFILDNDVIESNNNSKMTFHNIKLQEKNQKTQNKLYKEMIPIGQMGL
ncbi:MAG: hypothetical protein COB03_09420 [Alteromonas sp.]|nr:MAG: hypothetical protein COB03_09420 [Alteromonas sp.]